MCPYSNVHVSLQYSMMHRHSFTMYMSLLNNASVLMSRRVRSKNGEKKRRPKNLKKMKRTTNQRPTNLKNRQNLKRTSRNQRHRRRKRRSPKNLKKTTRSQRPTNLRTRDNRQKRRVGRHVSLLFCVCVLCISCMCPGSLLQVSLL